MAKRTMAQPKTTAAGGEDGREEYEVTERAPSRVAGRRVAKGDTLRLTADEARGELLALHIKPAGAVPEQHADVKAAASDL